MLGIGTLELVRYDAGYGLGCFDLHLPAVLHLQPGQPSDVDTYHLALL